MEDEIVLQLIYNSDTFNNLKEKQMSTKTASILARTEPETKRAAEELFAKLGLTTSGAINMFLHAAIKEGGIPFRVHEKRVPGIIYEDEITKEELKALLDESVADYKKNGGRPAEEVFEELNKKYGLKV